MIKLQMFNKWLKKALLRKKNAQMENCNFEKFQFFSTKKKYSRYERFNGGVWIIGVFHIIEFDIVQL